MTNNEANEIIAEFMGERFEKLPCGDCAIAFPSGDGRTILKTNYYTTSLDSLVPVWVKLGVTNHEIINRYSSSIIGYKLGIFDGVWAFYIESSGKTIQAAAAYATAKAILELEKDKDE